MIGGDARHNPFCTFNQALDLEFKQIHKNTTTRPPTITSVIPEFADDELRRPARRGRDMEPEGNAFAVGILGLVERGLDTATLRRITLVSILGGIRSSHAGPVRPNLRILKALHAQDKNRCTSSERYSRSRERGAYNGEVERMVLVKVKAEGLSSRDSLENRVITVATRKGADAEWLDATGVRIKAARAKIASLGEEWEVGQVPDGALQPTVLVGQSVRGSRDLFRGRLRIKPVVNSVDWDEQSKL